MERKYRVLVVGDDTNPAGRIEAYWAEFVVSEELAEDTVFNRSVLPAAMAAWNGYREQETMAEAVNTASKP